MKTLRTLLREGDPVDREPALAPDDVERMRRAVLASAESAPSRAWTMRVAIAAAVSLFVGVGMWIGPSTIRPRPAPQPIDEPDQAAAPAIANDQRRQVQFATPGGTRIIWVFDSNFNVR
jgi:hypothetical protein